MSSSQQSKDASPLGCVVMVAIVFAGWVIWMTAPVSLFLLGGIALLLFVRGAAREWMKALVPFLTAMTVGFAAVWLLDVIFEIAEPDVTSSTIARGEEWTLRVYEFTKDHLSFSWGASVAVLAVLGITSQFLHRDLLRHFLRWKKLAGLVTAALLAVTSFTFLGERFVLQPNGELVKQHYHNAIRHAHEAGHAAAQRAVRARAAALAFARLPPVDAGELRQFAERIIDSKIPLDRDALIATALSLPLEEPSPPPMDVLSLPLEEPLPPPTDALSLPLEERSPAPPEEGVVDSRTLDRQYHDAVERDEKVEENATAAERALQEVVAATAGVPKGAIVDLLSRTGLAALGPEGSAVAEVAKSMFEHVADTRWDETVRPQLDRFANGIVRLLRPQQGESGEQRADRCEAALIQHEVADLAQRASAYKAAVDNVNESEKSRMDYEVTLAEREMSLRAAQLSETKSRLARAGVLSSTGALTVEVRAMLDGSTDEALRAKLEPMDARLVAAARDMAVRLSPAAQHHIDEIKVDVVHPEPRPELRPEPRPKPIEMP